MTLLSSRAFLLQPKQFYRRVETIFRSIGGGTHSSELFARNFIPRFLENLGESLDIEGVHLYDRISGSPVLLQKWGEPGVDCGNQLNWLVSEFPWIGPLASKNAAVLPVGEDASLIMVFFSNFDGEDGSYFTTAFSAIHYALLENLRRLELVDTLEQARAIQVSLLPCATPHFGNFDIFAASVPARDVGGDVYDFQKLDSDTMAITIADAAGHGLPAALQARDVVTGIRMAIHPEMDLPSVVRRMNSVIHQSGLVSRFVSMIFGRLRLSGIFDFVNAGHPRPLLCTRDGLRELSSAGMIMGADPNHIYTAGSVRLDEGSLLALFSDGILEHADQSGKEFGLERLKQWMSDWRLECSVSAVKDLFSRLKEFSDGSSFKDDATILVIRRPE